MRSIFYLNFLVGLSKHNLIWRFSGAEWTMILPNSAHEKIEERIFKKHTGKHGSDSLDLCADFG